MIALDTGVEMTGKISRFIPEMNNLNNKERKEKREMEIFSEEFSLVNVYKKTYKNSFVDFRLRHESDCLNKILRHELLPLERKWNLVEEPQMFILKDVEQKYEQEVEEKVLHLISNITREILEVSRFINVIDLKEMMQMCNRSKNISIDFLEDHLCVIYGKNKNVICQAKQWLTETAKLFFSLDVCFFIYKEHSYLGMADEMVSKRYEENKGFIYQAKQWFSDIAKQIFFSQFVFSKYAKYNSLEANKTSKGDINENKDGCSFQFKKISSNEPIDVNGKKDIKYESIDYNGAKILKASMEADRFISIPHNDIKLKRECDTGWGSFNGWRSFEGHNDGGKIGYEDDNDKSKSGCDDDANNYEIKSGYDADDDDKNGGGGTCDQKKKNYLIPDNNGRIKRSNDGKLLLDDLSTMKHRVSAQSMDNRLMTENMKQAKDELEAASDDEKVIRTKIRDSHLHTLLFQKIKPYIEKFDYDLRTEELEIVHSEEILDIGAVVENYKHSTIFKEYLKIHKDVEDLVSNLIASRKEYPDLQLEFLKEDLVCIVYGTDICLVKKTRDWLKKRLNEIKSQNEELHETNDVHLKNVHKNSKYKKKTNKKYFEKEFVHKFKYEKAYNIYAIQLLKDFSSICCISYDGRKNNMLLLFNSMVSKSHCNDITEKIEAKLKTFTFKMSQETAANLDFRVSALKKIISQYVCLDLKEEECQLHINMVGVAEKVDEAVKYFASLSIKVDETIQVFENLSHFPPTTTKDDKISDITLKENFLSVLDDDKTYKGKSLRITLTNLY